MFPLAQGLVPPKSATCLLYFPSTLWSVAQPGASGKEKQNDAMKAAAARKLMPEWDFLYHFFKSGAEFKMNTCTE